jgi:hypothetical protein
VDHALELHAQPGQQTPGAVILRRDDCGDAAQTQRSLCEVQRRGRRLAGVAVAPESRQQCEAQVDVLEPVSLDQAADPQGGSRAFQFDQV